MQAYSIRGISLILAIDLFILALCGLGVYRLSQKAGFPAVTKTIESTVPIGTTVPNGSALIVSSSSEPLLKSGDRVVSVDGQHVVSDYELEFLCDQYSVGEAVPVSVVRNGAELSVSAALIRDYPDSKIIVESFAAFIYFLTGIAVITLQKNDRPARIFHHLAISIAALILLTTGRFTVSPFGIGYALEIVFQCAYVIVPALFFHFTLIFQKSGNRLQGSLRKNRITFVVVYCTAAVLTLWSAMTFLRAAYPTVHLDNYRAYGASVYAVLLFFVILFLAGFAILLHSYRTAKAELERRKLRWIFFGIVFGVGEFLALFLLPKFIAVRNLDEQYSIAFSVIAPISFAIAIIRFKVFDIDLFLKRTTVYAIAISVLLFVYISIIALFTQIVFALNLPAVLPNIIGAIFIASLFEPLRRRIQKFVDKKFFRVSYDFHEAQHRIFEGIKFANTKTDLANIVTERILALLPVTKFGFLVVDTPTDWLKLLAHRNFDILERHNIHLKKDALKTGLERPVAMDEAVEPGADFETGDREVFKRWGLALVMPMLSSNRQILGFLVLGEKLSGTRFIIEDMSLLTSVSTQAGLALEHLNAEYALLLKQAESERLAELSRLKSYFVSSVSHDLKTPLTSIRLFAEIIKDHDDLPRSKAVEYLGIIEGESDRLARLITTVLDFAKIEKGTKEYLFRNRDLNEIARDVMRSLDYQVTSRGFYVKTTFCPEPLNIQADYDAVFDAVTNLISNAMKYSPSDRKHITIVTASKDDFAILSVQDEGYGIANNEIEHIFESFYRIDDPKMKSAGGAGIGLSLVKHTMDAHQGKVEVESEPGKGSIFALHFPLIAAQPAIDHLLGIR